MSRTPHVSMLAGKQNGSLLGSLKAKLNTIETVSLCIGAAAGCTLSAFVCYIILANPGTKPATNGVTGACAALNMVAAHGRLDDVGYRRVVRALTGDMSPNGERFTVRYQDMMKACQAARPHHNREDAGRLAQIR